MQAGSHDIFVTEASFAMVFGKVQAMKESFMVMKCPQPSRLQSLNSNKAAYIRDALRQLTMVYDEDVDKRFFRVIDAFTCDAFKANLRAKRAIHQEHACRSSLGLRCDALNMATVATLSFQLLRPVESRMIRLSLSISGDAMQSIRREARAIIREQLVVIQSGRCTADADLHRNLVYDNFIPKATPFCKFRGAVIRKLWNGDIRKRWRIEHYCFGCCRSFGHTVSQMCNEGIRCCMVGASGL